MRSDEATAIADLLCALLTPFLNMSLLPPFGCYAGCLAVLLFASVHRMHGLAKEADSLRAKLRRSRRAGGARRRGRRRSDAPRGQHGQAAGACSEQQEKKSAAFPGYGDNETTAPSSSSSPQQLRRRRRARASARPKQQQQQQQQRAVVGVSLWARVARAKRAAARFGADVSRRAAASKYAGVVLDAVFPNPVPDPPERQQTRQAKRPAEAGRAVSPPWARRRAR